jgi:hypothetical protein
MGLVEGIDNLLNIDPVAKRHSRAPPCSRASFCACTSRAPHTDGWPHTCSHSVALAEFIRRGLTQPPRQGGTATTETDKDDEGVDRATEPKPTPTTTSQPPRRRRPRRCHQLLTHSCGAAWGLDLLLEHAADLDAAVLIAAYPTTTNTSLAGWNRGGDAGAAPSLAHQQRWTYGVTPY